MTTRKPAQGIEPKKLPEYITCIIWRPSTQFCVPVGLRYGDFLTRPPTRLGALNGSVRCDNKNLMSKKAFCAACR